MNIPRTKIMETEDDHQVNETSAHNEEEEEEEHRNEEAEVSEEEDDTKENDDEGEQDSILLSPMQRVHVFIYQIYNIIRNIDLLKQYTSIKYSQSSRPPLQRIDHQSSSMLSLPPPPSNRH
jgi:ABC-type Zn2+ transport system substrate-binding protein/surface adhesin